MPYSAKRGADSRSLARRRDVIADKEVEVLGGIGHGREESLYVLPLVCAHDWPLGLIQARNDLPEVVTRPERATIAVEYLLKGGLGDREIFRDRGQGKTHCATRSSAGNNSPTVTGSVRMSEMITEPLDSSVAPDRVA